MPKITREILATKTVYQLNDHLDMAMSKLVGWPSRGYLWVEEDDRKDEYPDGPELDEDAAEYLRMVINEMVERLEEWDNLISILGNMIETVLREGKLTEDTAIHWAEKIIRMSRHTEERETEDDRG